MCVCVCVYIYGSGDSECVEKVGSSWWEGFTTDILVVPLFLCKEVENAP